MSMKQKTRKGIIKMAKVKNKLRQPLVLDTAQGAIHFLSKETKQLDDSILNEAEVKNHVEKGNLIIIRLGQ